MDKTGKMESRLETSENAFNDMKYKFEKLSQDAKERRKDIEKENMKRSDRHKGLSKRGSTYR